MIMLPHHRRFAAPFALALLLSLAAAPIGVAGVARAAEGDSPTLSTQQVEHYWKLQWRNFARRTVKIGSDFYALSAYEPQFPSSRGVTVAQLRAATTKEVTERIAINAKIKRYLVRPAEDLQAAAESLPGVRVGHYGRLHSTEILEVLAPDVLGTGNAWVIDPDALKKELAADEEKLERAGLDRTEIRTVLEWGYEARNKLAQVQRDRDFRQPVKLVGFSSVGLAKGDRWRGPDGRGIDIAIVASYVPQAQRSSRSAKPILIGIPLEKFRTNAIDSETVFLEYLKSKSYTKEQFAQLFVAEHLRNPRDERLRDARIFATLEGTLEEEGGAGNAEKK